MKIVLLSIISTSFLIGMSEDYTQYLTFIKQRVSQLADVQPPLTDHQIVRLLEESGRLFEDNVNLSIAFYSDDTQAADHILRTLINNILKNTVTAHGVCKEMFCYNGIVDTYCNFIYENKDLNALHHLNKHQFKVMLQHLDETDDTVSTKKLSQLMAHLYTNNCSAQEKEEMIFLTENLYDTYKDKINEHKNCIGYEYYFVQPE